MPIRIRHHSPRTARSVKVKEPTAPILLTLAQKTASKTPEWELAMLLKGTSSSDLNEQEPITQKTAEEGQDETELNNSDSDQQTLDNIQEGDIEKDISQQQANALDTSSENDTQS